LEGPPYILLKAAYRFEIAGALVVCKETGEAFPNLRFPDKTPEPPRDTLKAVQRQGVIA